MRLLAIVGIGTVFQAFQALAIAPKVKDGSSRSQTVSSDALKAGRKYLITSFPQLKQVAAWLSLATFRIMQQDMCSYFFGARLF